MVCFLVLTKTQTTLDKKLFFFNSYQELTKRQSKGAQLLWISVLPDTKTKTKTKN
jgi:hypothetical protein